jgi:bifunctional non-homologous end joining protein LigD
MPGQAAGEIPGFIAPMLATGVTGLPPDAAGFVAEVKWDGLRACVAVAGGQVRAWSRSGRDITAAYPELGLLAGAARGRTLVLDGEIVALSGPRPDFTALQRRMTAGRPGTGLLAAVPVTLIVFDVLRSGREDLAGSPYVLRRALLDDLGLQVPGTVQVPPAFPGEAAVLLTATGDQGWEGIVLKRPASLYHPGRRTRDWLKIRHIRTAGVRVGGWLPGTGARAHLAGSVLMGVPRPGALEFAGAVGSGLSMAELRELTGLLESLEQPVSPFTGPLPPALTRHARWARPVITAEVTYLERTPSGRLRQPVWRGLRPGLASRTGSAAGAHEVPAQRDWRCVATGSRADGQAPPRRHRDFRAARICERRARGIRAARKPIAAGPHPDLHVERVLSSSGVNHS